MLKSRDITLLTEVRIIKATVFPVVVYRCKKRLSTEELMPLNCGTRETLESPWTARRSNQSILKEINPEYSLEGLMLKLKLQYFGHLIQRTDSFEKTPKLGNIEGGRRRG